MEIGQPRLKASPNHIFCNMVTPLLHAARNPGNGNIFIGQRQKPQLNLVSKLLPSHDLLYIAQSRQRGFKCKTVTGIDTRVNFFQHQAACFERCRLWIEGCQSCGYQVRVDEPQGLCFSGKKVAGKCGFIRFVGSCNDDDFFQVLTTNFMWADYLSLAPPAQTLTDPATTTRAATTSLAVATGCPSALRRGRGGL